MSGFAGLARFQKRTFAPGEGRGIVWVAPAHVESLVAAVSDDRNEVLGTRIRMRSGQIIDVREPATEVARALTDAAAEADDPMVTVE